MEAGIKRTIHRALFTMETTVKDTSWSSLKARGSKTNKKKSSEEIFRRKYRIIFEASEKEKNSGRQREWTALMGSREDRVVKKDTM